MYVQDLKWWHWFAVSLLVGGVLAGVKLWQPAGEGEARRRTVSVEVFMREAGRAEGGLPVVRDVVVHPPREAGGETAQYVTCLVLDRAAGPQRRYLRQSMFAPVPFRLDARDPVGRPDYSVSDFLARKQVPHASAWWASPPMTVALWGGGSVLALGLVWPAALRLLVGAGFGRKAGQPYDLDRFGTANVPTPAAPRAAWSDDDLTRLDEREAAVAKGAGGPAPTAGAAPSPSAIPALGGGPADVARPVAGQEARQYQGEFYPVARAGPAADDPAHGG